MKIIILEGIATSGKTSIKNELIENFQQRGLSFKAIEETETLMPILDNTQKELSLSFLTKVMGKALATKKEILIFDRLYFTHIFRTKSTLKEFKSLEELIRKEATLIFLKIDEEKIPERIRNARKHRDPAWDKYVETKGNEEEVNQYYLHQQRELLSLFEESSLNKQIYNTSNMNFEGITNEILNSNNHFESQ